MPAKAKYHDTVFCERFSKIVAALGSEKSARQLTGIGRETYKGWKRAYRAGKTANKPLRSFFERVDDALGTHKAMIEQGLVDCFFPNNPHLALRWLQLKFPDEYSNRSADARAAESAESAVTERPLPRVIINYGPRLLSPTPSQGDQGQSE